ncbi:MAG: CDP-diacylglycerol--glycerol-3-phosphate 3-phosphatidyltransferase [Defluviitaleaceae bacterium]|nr:CDP-diacylglycerol--glycerol-3-phosphate 3-phosphatidyltransferase [Defluviitaleaceae bacterium]
MNLPNKITVLRVILIPAFLFIYMAKPFPDIPNEWIALILFMVAALTDALDGYLARKMGLVTNFGKLMDPLADKLLVCAAFIAFTASGTLPAWATIILISREFYISGLRMLALEQKIVVAASASAKLKTIFQIMLVVYILLPFPFNFFHRFDVITVALIIVTAAVSIYSAAEYTRKNKKLFEKV